MKFQPGDRFQIVGKLPSNVNYEGKLATVIELNVLHDKKYVVAIDGFATFFNWTDEGNMKKVGYFPLKVGDVIKYKKDNSLWKISYINDQYAFFGKCINKGQGNWSKNYEGSATDLGQYTIVLNQKNNSKMIQTLSSMLKRLLDADSQTLYKAGFINGDLELTDEGEKALMGILFDANKAALVVEAQAVIDDEAAKNK